VVRARERHVRVAAPLAWLGNRKVGQIGTLLTWFVPARHAHRVVVSWTGRELVCGAPARVTIGVRRADPLTASERAYFASLSPTVQRARLAAAPVRARA